MTKYIKPRKQSKFLAFTFGFLTGFVSFVLVVICFAYFAFYGLTIREFENFTGDVIIEEESGLTFLKDITLKDVVTSLKTVSSSGNGFSIAALEEALGEDIEINLDSILPSNIDVSKIEGYLKDYTEYQSIKDVPVEKLGTVLSDFLKKVTFGDVFEILEMASIDLDSYYQQYGVENFDELINYITQGDSSSLKDLQVLETPEIIKDLINLSRISDAIQIINGYMGDDKVYELITEKLNSFNLDYSMSEVKEIVDSITGVFGENASIVQTVKNLSLIFTEKISTLLAMKNLTSLQALPFLKTDLLVDFNDILNTYFSGLTMKDITITENVTLDASLDCDDNTTLLSIANGDLKDKKIGEIILANEGIFSIQAVKDAKFSSLAQENVTIFDSVTISELIEQNIIQIQDETLKNAISNKTLGELSNEDSAINTLLLKDLFTFRTGLLYNPRIYDSSIQLLLTQNYIYVRMSDLNDLGFTFDTDESEENEAGLLTTLPKNTSIKDVMNLDFNKIFKDKTLKDILESGGQTYEGFISLLYDIKVTDLLNKNLLDCFENSDLTLGDILGGTEMDSGLLNCLNDIKIYTLKEDINNIKIGDVLGLNVNTNYDSQDPSSKKYVKDNNPDSADIMINFANYKIMEIKDLLSSDATLGDLLGFEKDEHGNYIGDNKTLLALGKLKLDEIMDPESGVFSLKLGELLGFETDGIGNFVSDNKTLLALANYSLNDLMKTETISSLKVGDLLGLDKDSQTNEYICENKSILAIADFTISDLTEEGTFNNIVIGELLGLTKDTQTDKFVSDNKTLQAIANFTISDLTKADAFNSLKIGDLLGVDENGSNDILNAISQKTIGDFTNPDTLNNMTIGEILGIEDDNPNQALVAIRGIKLGSLGETTAFDGIVLGDLLGIDENTNNEILKALKNKTIGDLSDPNTLNNMTIGELLGVTNDTENKALVALKDIKIGELSGENAFDSILIGDILGIDENSDNQILKAIAKKTLGELSDPDTLNDMEVGQLFGLAYDETNGYSGDNPALVAIAKIKIGDLTQEGAFDNVVIGELLGLSKDEKGNYNDSNAVLNTIAKYTFKQLTDGTTIYSLKVGELLGYTEDSNGDFYKLNELQEKIYIDNSMAAIAKFTLDSLINGNPINDLKIGDLLGLESDGNGGFIDSNKTLQAISGLSISDLTNDPDCFNNMKIGDILGLTYDEINGYYITDDATIKAISTMTIGELTSSSDGISTKKIGDLLGMIKNPDGSFSSENTNKVLLAIADLSLNDLKVATNLNTIPIGKFLGLETDESGNFVSDNSILLAIADKTMADLNNADTLNDMKVGTLLGLTVEDGEFVSDNKILLAIATKTLSELKDKETLENLKIGDLLGLEYDSVNDKYVSDNTILLAFANKTLADLNKAETFDNMTIRELLGLTEEDESNKTLMAIADKTLSELKEKSTFENLKIGDLLGLEYDSVNGKYVSDSTILLAFADKTLADLNKAETFDNMTIRELLGLTEEDEDNKVLMAIADKTLSQLKEKATLENLKIGDLLGLEYNTTTGKYLSDNTILLAFADKTLADLNKASTFDNMTIRELLGLTEEDNDNKTLIAIADKTLSQLKNKATFENLEIGTLLGLEKDQYNNYISDSKILLAFANKTLAELNSADTFDNMQVGTLLGLTVENGEFVSDNKTLLAIADLTLGELNSTSWLDTIKIGDLIGLETDSYGNYVSDDKTLLAISKYTINEISGANGISTMQIGELFGLTKVGDNYQSDNKTLLAISKFTLADFAENGKGLSTLRVGDVIGLTISADYDENNALSVKYRATENPLASPLILNIANLHINSLDSEIENVINSMKVGEIINIETDASGNYVGDGSTSTALLCLANYKISELSNALDNQIEIGELIGLQKDKNTSEYVTTSAILKLVAKEKLSTISTNLDIIVKNLTIGDCLNIKITNIDDELVFPDGTPKVLQAIYDTKIGELSSKIDNLIVGDALEVEGAVYNEATGDYDFPDGTSVLIQSIYSTKLNELAEKIENLTISQVIECSGDGILSKINPNTSLNGMEDAILNLEITDICTFGDNSLLSLLPAGTTLSNLGNAQIDVSSKTIGELINYGLINDNGYNTNLKNATIQDLLDAINEGNVTALGNYFG